MTTTAAEGTWRYKLVIVVRADVKLSAGKLAAQVAHAAVDCALEAQEHERKVFAAWYAEGQRKVVLKVADEPALHRLARTAKEAGLVTSLIRDAGLTEVAPGTVTALGLGPAQSSLLDPLTGALTLL